ncbi:calcium/sodium antiporter [uncultured Brachyspira sp.]|uniref:calcium/sodium antiporter n=1 Tax=uncultured Brachyspira sp. TaxID=221953 RepID=UPI0025E255C8|nr:calcium/sodium antiporter [uncultured Brachyspira sp.]
MENILLNIVFTAAGIVLLYLGGTYIVDGSVMAANRLKIPTIVIGLTVVSMGTSMPELFVSLFGALRGESSIAVGNVIGSNIFNIVFVLGMSALFMNMSANKKSYYVSMIFMFIMYAALFIMLFNIDTKNLMGDKISIIEGIILIILLCIYIYYLYSVISKDKDELEAFEKEVSSSSKTNSIGRAVFKIIIAVLALAFGSDVFIKGVTGIFRNFLSEHIIGFIVIAVGTSIPELVTSLIAAIKKEADISIGNIVGSNIFNVGAVLGISSAASFKFGGIILSKTQNYLIDFSIMVFVGILLLIFTIKGKSLNKLKGIIFLIVYIAYVFYLFKTTSVS